MLNRLSLEIPAGSSLAIVGQNGAGKTTLAKLLCRLYDPQSGAIEVDGTDLRDLDLEAWRRQVTVVFQDFVRFELTLRENVAPRGTAEDDAGTSLDETINAALGGAGATGLAGLGTVLAKGYTGGTDLSGGQWQRVALARAIAAVRLGAGSSCSTSRRPSLTSAARRRSSSGSWRPPGRARRSSSRTGSTPSGTSTGSRSSSDGPSPNWAATTS